MRKFKVGDRVEGTGNCDSPGGNTFSGRIICIKRDCPHADHRGLVYCIKRTDTAIGGGCDSKWMVYTNGMKGMEKIRPYKKRKIKPDNLKDVVRLEIARLIRGTP